MDKQFQNELGEVFGCDCGGVNLTMGPMTLHFSTEEVDALKELIDAAQQLCTPSDGNPKHHSGRPTGSVH